MIPRISPVPDKSFLFFPIVWVLPVIGFTSNLSLGGRAAFRTANHLPLGPSKLLVSFIFFMVRGGLGRPFSQISGTSPIISTSPSLRGWIVQSAEVQLVGSGGETTWGSTGWERGSTELREWVHYRQRADQSKAVVDY